MPACLGNFRNFELLYNKLCSQCNSEIGLIEEQFCRCGPEAFFRRIIGIKGRRHHKSINPFYRGSAGGQRIVMKTTHPTLDCSIFCEIEEGGGVNAYPASQVIVRDSEGKYHPILITPNIKTAHDLRSEIEAKKLGSCNLVECWASSEEEEWIEKLCEGFDVRINWSETTPYQKMGNVQFVATFTVNSYYFRAIAKVAFHYFLKHFKQFTGHEDELMGIKLLIREGGDPDQWVKQVRGSFVMGLIPGVTTTDKYGHFLVVEKNERYIRAKLHFFVGPKGAPPQYYEVLIGKNPERIIYPQSIGHQFVYFDEIDEDGYCGRVDELRTISRQLLL